MSVVLFIDINVLPRFVNFGHLASTLTVTHASAQPPPHTHTYTHAHIRAHAYTHKHTHAPAVSASHDIALYRLYERERTMTQAVSRRPLNAEVRFRSKASP